MGNSITISIALDYEQQQQQQQDNQKQPQVAVAGQPMGGKVIVKVGKRMNGETVQLVALGKEQVRHGKAVSEMPFLHVNTTLQDLRGKKVKRGTYIYPFRLILPVSLPTSTNVRSSSSGQQGQITYKVAAMFGAARYERVFQVASRPLPPVAVPCFIEPKTETIKSMGFRTVGNVTFAVMVHDTHVGRGQELLLALACQNESSVDIGRVRAKLVELVTLQSKHTVQTQKNTLMESNDLSLPGLVKNRSSKRNLKVTTTNNTIGSQDGNGVNAAIYDALVRHENLVSIPIPQTAHDTYDGKIIKVEHYLKISLETSSYFSDNLSAKIPLKIGQPSEESTAVFMQPPEAVVAEAQLAPHRAEDIGDGRDDGLDEVESIPFANAVPLVPLEDTTEDPEVIAPPVVATAHILRATVPIEREDDFDANETAVEAEPEPQSERAQTSQEQNPEPVQSEQHPDGSLRILREGEEDEFAIPSAPLDDSFGSNTDDDGETEAESNNPVSLGTLLNDMKLSINVYDTVVNKAGEASWQEFYAALTPEDFGSVVGGVGSAFDQPRVGAALAGHIDTFTCQHCICALRAMSGWNRPALVKALLPKCTDLFRNSESIKKELSVWEKTVTAADFRNAIPAHRSTVF